MGGDSGETARLAESCRAAIAELRGPALAAGSPHSDHACGVLLYCAGLFAEAAEAFRRAVGAQPRAKNLYLLGLCCQGLGDCAGALDAFRKAIAADPDLLLAYYQSASIHRSAGRFDSAVEILGQALRRFGGTTYESYVCNELGLTLEMHGRLEEAAAYVRRAAQAPGADNLPAQVNLAWLLYKLRRLAEARRILDAVVARGASRAALHPLPHTCFLAYYTLGSVALEQGDPRSARDLLARALEYSPGSAPAWNSLAIAHEGAGDRGAALEALRRAVRCDPEFAAARRNLAHLVPRTRPEASSCPT